MDTQHSQDRAPRMWRWIGGLGMVYAVLYAVGFVLLNHNEPGIKASPSKLVSFYAGHNGQVTTAVLAFVLGSVAFAFFVGAVRHAVSSGEDGSRMLSGIAAVGAAVYISGLLLNGALNIALLDAGHYGRPGVAAALNFLAQDDFFPVVAGAGIFMLATGVAILQAHTLPVWLGWSALLVGVLAVAGPLGAVAFVLAPIWVLVAALLLVIGKPSTAGQTRSAQAPSPAVAPAG